MHCDLGSLSSIKTFVNTFNESKYFQNSIISTFCLIIFNFLIRK